MVALAIAAVFVNWIVGLLRWLFAPSEVPARAKAYR